MAIAIGTVEKQPAEVINILFDFASAVVDGITLSLVSILETTGDITITNKTISGQRALCTIAGGTDGIKYKVTCLVTTSDGETLEADGVVKVKAR